MKRAQLFAIAAAGVLSGTASAQGGFEAIVPDGMEGVVENFEYSPAVRAGDFVYLSGVVAGLPMSEEGIMAPSTDENLTAAFDEAFQAIEQILVAAGGDWADVVEMTTFHTDLPGQIDAFFAVKQKWQKAPFPAWTAIDIDRLYTDNGVVEIKVIAYIPQK